MRKVFGVGVNDSASPVSKMVNGKQLDKDVLRPGNHIYSPDACCFVSSEVNGLLKSPKPGRYAQGVALHKAGGRFEAKISINNQQIRIGCFGTEKEASDAYKKAKAKRIIEVAEKQEEAVRDGLMAHANILLEQVNAPR